MMDTKRGQLALGNYIGLLFVLIIAVALMPALTSLINASSTTMNTTPNDGTGLAVTVMELLPMLIIVCIILTAIWYSIPSFSNRGGQ